MVENKIKQVGFDRETCHSRKIKNHLPTGYSYCLELVTVSGIEQVIKHVLLLHVTGAGHSICSRQSLGGS
jgi:hypothetical protein